LGQTSSLSTSARRGGGGAATEEGKEEKKIFKTKIAQKYKKITPTPLYKIHANKK
jgi:hypothetical protein